MMAAAENIADLRSILSIVAEETGALKMEDADEDSVGWTTEGPLPMTFGHVRRAHAALAALEAALSAAEPVSANLNVFVCYDGVIFATENSAKEYCKDRNFALGGMGYNKKPLQGDFTHPAPSVAVKALQDHVLADFTHLTDAQALSGPYIVKRIKERFGSFALSAQLQDVAVAEIVSKYGDPEAFGERELIPLVDIQKYPYGTKLYAAAPAKQEG
ncbi:hypothetical protein [Agrobacterium sp. YIC 4121]|uniref:hypothetical protein n=1 Tax=Agrobacterium sp. YIC 4121 TaxID=1923829 RepID=UPI001178A561|nr:hypothetical protein [Agrobacterium sp. YIC 4121]